MSIGAYSAGEASVAAQAGMHAVSRKRPPRKRLITAKADETELPEAR